MSSLVNVVSASEIFRAQVELLVVTTNDDTKSGNILVTHADASLSTVPFVAGSTKQLTRDAMKNALEASPVVAALYTMADVSTDGVSMTQIKAGGAFTAVGNALQGALVITPSTTTSASFTIPRYLLKLRSPVAGSTGDVYVSRDTGRGCTGEYALVANAVTDSVAPSISVEDTNGLLAPTPGPALASESSGYMDNGLTTAKNGPLWVKDWILNKEEIEIGGPVTTRPTVNLAYTILSTDKMVYLSTTGAGNVNLTFATGLDGQEVTCVMIVKSSSAEYVIVGIEGLSDNLAAVNDCFTAVYDATGDKWYLKANEIA